MNQQVLNVSPVIVALDFSSGDDAVAFATTWLDKDECQVKVGLELFVAEGPSVVNRLQELGFKVFLDLEFPDIPETTMKAILVAARLGVWMVNIHADKLGKKWHKKEDGHPSVFERLNTGLEKIGHRPIIIAVTVLTSMDEDDLTMNGVLCPPRTVVGQVLKLALNTEAFGFDGVVASGEEAKPVRHQAREGFIIVTPAVRLPDGDPNDQARITTPEKAIGDGADFIVVGRPVTEAKNPRKTFGEFYERAMKARSRGLISQVPKVESAVQQSFFDGSDQFPSDLPQ